MGLNTKHNKIRDVANGYNLSKKSVFKFELMPQSEIAKIEATMGVIFAKQTDVIKINGRCTIEEGDKVKLFGLQRIVSRVQPINDNMYEMGIKDYLDDSYGETIVMLE